MKPLWLGSFVLITVMPPHATNAHLWSKASEINLDNVLNYIHNKTYAMTQNLQNSSLFRPVAPAPNDDTVNASQIKLGVA